MIKETRVGYRTLAELINIETTEIKDCWANNNYPLLVYHIEKYKELKKEYND